jgi:ubiquinone/menaquinone biosynthesis C-methylase UbiE
VKASPTKLQHEYYVQTASSYDSMHNANEGIEHEHNTALRLIHTLSGEFGCDTFLDVGCGTGRGVQFFLERGRKVTGVEPVSALIQQAVGKGIPESLVIEGSGYSLPFADKSFDAVFECGVLHHVEDPYRIVQEMMRVARKAVFLSDSNRFGQGHYALRLIKLCLYKARLWPLTRAIQTKGKGYTISDADGLAYSYSVFDSYNQLYEWSDDIWLLPTSPKHTVRSWCSPLLTHSHALLCAFRHR